MTTTNAITELLLRSSPLESLRSATGSYSFNLNTTFLIVDLVCIIILPKLQKILQSCGQLGVPVIATKKVTQPKAFGYELIVRQ